MQVEISDALADERQTKSLPLLRADRVKANLSL